MITTDSPRGHIALMETPSAGMVDLVTPPVSLGALMSVYCFDPQRARRRARAATRAMPMFGAATGPVLRGTLVKTVGCGGIGLAAVRGNAAAVCAFFRIPNQAGGVLSMGAIA